jgi:hypothetical protein
MSQHDLDVLAVFAAVVEKRRFTKCGVRLVCRRRP